MSPGDDAADNCARAAAERERRRRAAALLGDLLPESTSDDMPDAADTQRGGSPHQGRDDELMRDVPPHHGG
ncbi:hypothetical protein [Aeromicrobium sp. CTD01-1L150]|uniref:hypothetical protein n=1 Tax=Aeromicrobium sp. CTD01-1L150 TaxID=3341830 RepID=UPI0035BF8B84